MAGCIVVLTPTSFDTSHPDGYGDGTPEVIVDQATAVFRQTYLDVTSLAQNGHEPKASWIRSVTAKADLIRADWIVANRDHLL